MAPGNAYVKVSKNHSNTQKHKKVHADNVCQPMAYIQYNKHKIEKELLNTL